ncbi:MAG: sigma-70 family RNA polymerase sigma factor [Planctomycetota bacterium]
MLLQGRAMIDGASDPVLVRRAKAGDASAFGVLAERNERAGLAVAHAVLGDADLAADAVQDALLKAWHALPSLQNPSAFRGWLLRTVRNAAHDVHRRRRPAVRLVREPATNGGVDHELADALATLDEPTRLAVTMRYYEGASSADIAAVLDCSPAAVDMRLSRGRQRLKELLNDD